jgi:hypothetical protein
MVIQDTKPSINGDVARWYSARFACERPRVRSPASPILSFVILDSCILVIAWSFARPKGYLCMGMCLSGNGSIINCEIMMHNGNITSCTTFSRVWYELLVGVYYRPPASQEQGLFVPNIPFESVWRTVHISFKPPDTVDLDFRFFHNVIYTKEKLCKIGKVDSSVCTLCGLETEDLSHMFIECIELDDTKQYVVEIHEGLFSKSDVSYVKTCH